MKIGISLSNYGVLPSRSLLKGAALEIERLELDSIWVSDHIIVPKNDTPWNRVFESVTTLGFLASITESIRLGSSILLVPLREPLLLAKQIATLDSLSNGRVMIGVGIGWNKKEFDLLGYNFKDRSKIVVENIDIMRKMWAGEYSKQGYSCEPMPVSKNGPPILIGGQSAGALKRVASIGDGWHPVGISAQEYDLGIQKITQMKKSNFIWSLRINFAANQKIESQYTGADGHPRLRLTGNIDEIISQIQEYQKIGLSHLVCDIKANSKKEYFEQLKTVGEIKKSF
ncbi:MAG: TIGR03619 family F420-dependent LLM class oxidoreductase [Nitrosopumilus sp.]|nr:TIGR03619 family F420-dependent LLM class oxidoreductase [Nitrosopumilus sp.]MDH3487881.1 TIGR03619 family F420-dependent LLM class oxidoreductase [Nitrosopumilus sp.]